MSQWRSLYINCSQIFTIYVYSRLLKFVCGEPSVLWHCWLGDRKGIRPVKNWVVGCWCGYVSGARCRLAYGPADATATHCLTVQLVSTVIDQSYIPWEQRIQRQPDNLSITLLHTCSGWGILADRRTESTEDGDNNSSTLNAGGSVAEWLAVASFRKGWGVLRTPQGLWSVKVLHYL